MRAALEKRLNEIWYRDAQPPWYLRMLTPVYRALFGWDQRRQHSNRARDLDGKCIVVVGNLTAGGSGKTPLVIRLCALLRNAGLNPGVVSRGYGREDRQQQLVVAGSDPAQVGDEPLLIARRSRVPVMVGPDRAAAARELFARGADVVVSDDGLQHRRMPRALEICVVDGARGLGNGYLLPAGPLREGSGRLKEVDYIVINGDTIRPLPDLNGVDELDKIRITRMEIHARKVYALADNLSWRLSQFAGCKVNAVVGIANPERFFTLLRQAGIEVLELVYPDHHNFSTADFESLNKDLPIIMTEKDAVKCKDLSLQNAWYLSVDAHLSPDWEKTFVRQVREFVGES